MDLPKLTSRMTPRSSANDLSTRDVSMSDGRSLSSRSNVPTHEINETQQSSYDPLREKYYLNIEYEDNNNETQPPIPPRRSKSRPTSTISEQDDA